MSDDILRSFILIEAINSVAIEHPDGCDCIVCRAASGDPAGFAEVMTQVRAEQERREREGDDG